MEGRHRINPHDQIVDHDAPAAGQFLRTARWKRFPDVQGAEDEEGCDQDPDSLGQQKKRNPLTDKFIPDRLFGIVAVLLFHRRADGDADKKGDGDEYNLLNSGHFGQEIPD